MKKNKKVSKFIKIFDYKMWFYDLVKIIGCIPALIDLRMKITYVKEGKVSQKPKGLFKGTFLVISNHISYEDPVIISNAFWKRRVGYIATKELFEGKIFGIFLKGCGCIPINKENVSMSTFKKVKERFEKGHIVAMFPEGQVEKEEINSFKSGAVLIALTSEVPIIPIYLERRKNRMERQKVYIGEKINIIDYCDSPTPTIDTINKIAEILRNKELELENISNNK